MTAYANPKLGALGENIYFGRYTFALLPAASSANDGLIAEVSDIGGSAGSLWISDGTIWKPLHGAVDLGATGITASVTGTVSKTALATIALPRGLIIPGAQLKCEPVWTFTNSANNKTLSIEIGATLGAATVLRTTTRSTSVASESPLNTFTCKTVTSVEAPYVQNSNYSGGSAATVAAITVPDVSSNDLNLYICGTLANTGETISLNNYRVSLIYPT